MKIAIITRHAIANYGSLLQAFATQKVIELLGHESYVIDYVKECENYRNHEKTLLKRKPKWNKNVLTRSLYLLLRQPESILVGKKFDIYQRRYLNLSHRYSTQTELIYENNADVYMTGSDQVWGPTEDGTYDDVYCFGFIKNKKKIAYAASFGHTDFNEELKQYYKKRLSDYASITVREESAVNILKEIGIQSEMVLDPTLLLNKKQWMKYTECIKDRRYILVYQLHNDKRLGEYAQKVSKLTGLPIIRVSVSLHQFTRPGRLKWCVDLKKFLGYVDNAEIMITDSFHGTAFAINFNTNFVEILPNNNTSTRNVSILNLTNLSDRILKDYNDTELALKKIDFSYANKKIQKLRDESINIMKDMIER